MKLSDFIKDRIGYIVVYIISTALAILVMNLTLVINKIYISGANIFYAFIISGVLLIVFFIYDYYRNSEFYSQLNLILKSTGDFDCILNIGSGHTREQRMIKIILSKLYRSFENKKVKYEEVHKEYIYFVNQWVHQMKTPVSVINLILQDEIDEEHRELFQSISEENEKLQQGLDTMLYNARLNEFDLDFTVEALDIIKVLRKAINANKKSLIRYHIFPKLMEDKNVIVETDKKWIYFVINQIVINAIKYSRVKEGNNKHIIFYIKKEVSKTILSIKDEGIGIPKEDLTRVFNAFFTGKNGRKTDESTGMGMYLAKKICDKLGHDILVKSEEGKGAEFSIIFYGNKSIFKL
ncbi:MULTISPECIES: sensor histidine kinase [Clostridium]|uniref:sensor histidine kinase n=1 Tax=Clostridium TaxID=1485 RepID=UPI00082428D8|nr:MULTISPECIES: sensor histidine kinase [Clostridium]PJI06795.1 sensor histidine kinase [Clostridium sp. CT7]